MVICTESLWPTVQYSAVQYSTVQYSTVQYSTEGRNSVKYIPESAEAKEIQELNVYSNVEYSTIHYSTVQYRS